MVWVLAGRGKQLYLPPGTNLELELAAPQTFKQNQLDFRGDPTPAPPLPRQQVNRERRSKRFEHRLPFGAARAGSMLLRHLGPFN